MKSSVIRLFFVCLFALVVNQITGEPTDLVCSCSTDPQPGIGGNSDRSHHQLSSSSSSSVSVQPVCGSNNRTYASACHLNCDPAITMKHVGRCQSPPTTSLTTHGGQQQKCLTKRVSALNSLVKSSSDDPGTTFIPECSDDGTKWKPVQCHKSTGYCWCVQQHDGKVVPGSSALNRKPDCDRMSK